MKSNNIRITSAITLLALALSPIAASAQATGTAHGTVGSGFCTALGARSSTVTQRLADLDAKLAAKRTERDANVAKRTSDHNATLATLRASEDQKRADRYASLALKADTDAKKLALAAFQAAVDAAVSARRVAIDTANGAFNEAVLSAIASRKTAADAVEATFKSSVLAAVASAQNNCTVGTLPADAIRDAYRSSIEAAQTKFRSDLQGLAKVSASVQTAITVRKAAHDQAISAFSAALEKAKADLKVAFGQTAN